MSIVLSLIVKNESRNIERLLHDFCIIEGIKDVLIVDTGSTDNTVKLSRQFYKDNDINGLTLTHVFYDKTTGENCECHPNSQSKRFKKFHYGENRSFAIDMCFKIKPQCSFIFMPDADSYFGLLGGASVGKPVGLEQYVQKYGSTHKRFYIFLAVGSNIWFRSVLFSNDDSWKYNCVLHEYLTSKNNRNWTPIYNADTILTPEGDSTGVKFYMQTSRIGGGGGRNDEANVVQNDAEFLEEVIGMMQPHEEDYWRYVYYCSQSWYEAKNFDKFDHFAEMVFKNQEKCWDEEVYCTYIRWVKSYLFKERLTTTDADDRFLAVCDAGIKVKPMRAELYYFKAKKLLEKKRSQEAIKALEPAIDLKPYPTAHLSETYTYDGCREMYFKLKQLKVGLVVTSPTTEMEILKSGYAEFLTKNCQSVKVFNFNSSFTGLLSFPHTDMATSSEILSKINDIDEIVFVETVIDCHFPKGISKVFLSLGKTNRVYSDVNFNIIWTQENRLLQFLRTLEFDIFRVHGESSKMISDSHAIMSTIEHNLCFTGKRNLNPNLLHYEMLLVPHSQLDPKRDYYTKSLAWDVFPLQRKVCNKFSHDPIAFFINAEKSMNDNSDNLEKLEEIHERISRKFNSLPPEFYLKESVNNIIAIRFVKDLFVKQIVNNPVQHNYELFQRPMLKSGTVNTEQVILNAGGKKIMMVMTTCRRYHLFFQTMVSILRKFSHKDLRMVHTFLIVDDGSSEEDLKKMRDDFGSLFEIFVTSGIPGVSKGHPYSMNYIRDRAIDEDFDYVIHLEDDFVFLDSKNYISDCLNIMENDSKVSQVMFNRNYHLRGSDELMYMNNLIGEVKRSHGVRYYHHLYNSSGTWLERAVHNQYDPVVLHDPLDPMRRTESWPGFSFHPSMYSVAKTLALIGPYVTHKEFERGYSIEMYWNTPYTTAFLDDFSVYHKGKIPGFDEPDQKQNAYDLNPEARPGAKILVVANLKTNKKFREFKESHKDVIYDVCWIDDYSTLNHARFTNPQQVIEYRESLLKNLPMYDEIIRCDDPIVIPEDDDWGFSFKMDIAGHDIGRFDNTHFQMTIEQMSELTLKLGGNAFNTLGYVKKIPPNVGMYLMPFFRGVSEGVYVLKHVR